MAQSKIYEEQFAYRYNLRSVTAGWTPERAQGILQVVQRGPHRRPASLRLPRVVQPREPAAAHRRQWPVPESGAHRGVATLTDAEKADPELAAILEAYRPPAPGRGGRGPAPPDAAAPPGRGRGGR